MKIFNRKVFLLKALSLILFTIVVLPIIHTGPVSAQVVSPVQGGHYAPGVLNIRDMAYPPSGLFVVWYNMFINSDKYIDKDGNEFKSLNLNQIHPALPNIDVDLGVNGFATVPGLFWGSNFTLPGGARYLVGISPNYVTADATIVTEMGIGIIDTTITRVAEDNVSGWSDLLIAPVGLSWAFEQFDVTAFYGFYAPVGKYETGGSDNVGLGFWTHQFQGFGYYYPFPSKATAVMLSLTYELNGKIKDADVKPGSRFSLEWGVSQYLSERLELGVQGGHNWQVSDDSGNGVFWDPAIHDRKSSIGFSVSYWPWKERLYVSLKYAFDFGIQQRFDNDCWIINLIFLPNLLTGE